MNYKKLFYQTFNYPSIDDPELQYKLYKKKEFYNYRIKHIPEFFDDNMKMDNETYDKLKKYRLKKCKGKLQLSNHQYMLTNFLNPNTSYKGLLLFHGLGTGKTCAAISIAEKFKKQVIKYNTKIYILVPGPVLKESWRNEIIKCGGPDYAELDNQNENQNILFQKINEVYRIMSYKSFYKRVLGEKIKFKNINNKITYQKTASGEFLRNESIDKLDNLNNSLLIIDEAHNITGNNFTDAIKKIIKKSTNLKILLLTATPMKNTADDIIDLLTILKPNQSIQRSKIFNNNNNHLLDFTTNGIDKLTEICKGCISYVKGGDKYIFAQRNDIGIIPTSLKFTKIIPCKMKLEQKKLYDEVILNYNDALEKASSDVCNFIFPILSSGTDKSIILTYGKTGKTTLSQQLLTNKTQLNELLNKYLKIKNYDENLIYLKDNKIISGNFLKLEYLKNFSTKFYKALKNINNLIYGKNNPKPAFIYSNLVSIGINMFRQILIENGYLEFVESTQQTSNNIKNNTKCYYCGEIYENHQHNKITIQGKASIKNSKLTLINVPEHDFYPACFILITGQSEKENDDDNENDRKIINNVFNSFDNYQGKYIKFILGSRVISEGYNLKNVGEVHILDVYYNFTRVDQVVGRAIRTCSHFDTATEQNPFPKVDVYKYCIYDKNEIKPSSEELLYQKAEKKHILIKRVERILKENAIDYLLNKNGNIDYNDIQKYNKCQKLEYGNKYDKQQIKDKNNICPASCDYMNCEYKPNIKFNENEKIDTTTFTNEMVIFEINRCKNIIKNMYLLKYVYILKEIVEYVENEYKILDLIDLFDIYYVYKGLDELIPITENEFINFKDIITDKFNKTGYLIYIDKFYIFQAFGENKNLPMYYRETHEFNLKNNTTLYDYLKNNYNLDKYVVESVEKQEYDFNSTAEYYSKRKENNIVGIIDKEPDKKKVKQFSELNDIFKTRDKIDNKTEFKRMSGLQTYTGTVCFNSYSYNELIEKLNKLKISYNKHKKYSRIELCNMIRDKLLDLEKYSTNNITYVIIPANHPIYPFPYNLKDRADYIVNKISQSYKNIIATINKKNKNYEIIIKTNKSIEDDVYLMEELKFNKIGIDWKLEIN